MTLNESRSAFALAVVRMQNALNALTEHPSDGTLYAFIVASADANVAQVDVVKAGAERVKTNRGEK